MQRRDQAGMPVQRVWADEWAARWLRLIAGTLSEAACDLRETVYEAPLAMEARAFALLADELDGVPSVPVLRLVR